MTVKDLTETTIRKPQDFAELLKMSKDLYDAVCDCSIMLKDEFYIFADERDEESAPITVMLQAFADAFAVNYYYEDFILDTEVFLKHLRRRYEKYIDFTDDRVFKILLKKYVAFATIVVMNAE